MKSDRGCYVGVPEVFSLGHCCDFIARAFGEHTCYLVGSATERPDFRDVDVVLIVPDEKWKALFGTHDNGEIIPFWSLMMTALSEYCAKRTGLKVDFKVQSMSQANKAPHGGKPRHPIGLFVDHANPAWTREEWRPAVNEERLESRIGPSVVEQHLVADWRPGTPAVVTTQQDNAKGDQ